MENIQPGLLALLCLVALLYSSVGHGGASGYLAALSLFGHPPAAMRDSALLLNLLVSGIAFLSYRRAGHFEAGLLWPFAASSIPLAFLGALLKVSPGTYSGLLALALVFAALRLMMREPGTGGEKPPSLPLALAAGAGIGLLSGIVGVGGGIFLSPLMLLLGWADVKRTAATSAAFIWVNSAAGLLAGLGQRGTAALWLWPLVGAALLGGLLGSTLGARLLAPLILRRALGLVLLVAAFKLAWSAFSL